MYDPWNPIVISERLWQWIFHSQSARWLALMLTGLSLCLVDLVELAHRYQSLSWFYAACGILLGLFVTIEVLSDNGRAVRWIACIAAINLAVLGGYFAIWNASPLGFVAVLILPLIAAAVTHEWRNRGLSGQKIFTVN